MHLAMRLDDGAERLPLEVLHGEVRTAVVHAKLVHRNDVTVAETGESGGFLLEAFDRVVVVAETGEDLDSDIASNGIARAIDSAVAALAELLFQLIIADLGQGIRRHSWAAALRQLGSITLRATGRQAKSGG